MSSIGTSHLYAKTTLETGQRFMRVGQNCSVLGCGGDPYDLLEFLNINSVDNNGHFTGSITPRESGTIVPPFPIIGDYNSTTDAISFTVQRLQPPLPSDLYEGYLMNTSGTGRSAMGGTAHLANSANGGEGGWMAWPVCNLC